MPGFSDESATLPPYRHHTWDTESYMVFKRDYDQTDKDKAAKMSSVTKVVWDEDKAREAKERQEKYRGEAEIESQMSARTAFIYCQLVDWFGPEFIVPLDRKDRHGNPHHLAGLKAPVTPFWVGKRFPDELEDIETWLNEQYKGMTRQEAETFRSNDGAVARPSNGKSPRDRADERVDEGLPSDAGPALAAK